MSGAADLDECHIKHRPATPFAHGPTVPSQIAKIIKARKALAERYLERPTQAQQAPTPAPAKCNGMTPLQADRRGESRSCRSRSAPRRAPDHRQGIS
jgi:hypothetical protein